MSEQPGAATPGAVFVDPSGRRRRRAHRLAVAAGLLIGSYLVLVAVALIAPPGALRLSIPGFGVLLPGSHAPRDGTGPGHRRGREATGPVTGDRKGAAPSAIAPRTGGAAATGVAAPGTAPRTAAVPGNLAVVGNPAAAGSPTSAGAAASAPAPAPTQPTVPGPPAPTAGPPTVPPGRSSGTVSPAPGSKRAPQAAGRPSHPATRPSPRP